MRALSFVNNINVRVESGQGPVLLAALDLEAGSYLVWGKITVGTNASGGYPPPPWPYASGAAFLALGSAADQAYFGVKPESAANNESISLMCAATIGRARRARLYLQSVYPLPVFSAFARVMALQVDTLAERENGDGRVDAPQDKDELLRDAVFKSKLTDLTMLSALLKDD